MLRPILNYAQWSALWMLLLLPCAWNPVTLALTVDNQLVSARNDCFERIALEAMLPFEKTFRTDDTNSLKMCKEKCIQAGEKCQSIAFGVHRRGNGTCQLSEEKYGMTSGRPNGVIFDPDFDLYARKTSCFDLSDDNTIATSPDTPSPSNGGYGPVAATPQVHLEHRPLDINGTPLLVVNPTPSTSDSPYNDRPSPTGSSYPSSQPQYVPVSTLGPASTTSSDGDRLYFSQDIYPLYKYPMLYEHNYPAPNDDFYIPGGYAANVPSIDDRYRPPTAQSDEHLRPTPQGPPTALPPRPMFGLGYGNGYGYGNPEPYSPSTLRPHNSMPEPRPTHYTPQRPYGSTDDGPHRPYGSTDDRPPRPYGSTDDGPQPTSATSYRPQPPPPPRPTQDHPGVDYNNRPDPPHDSGYGSRPPPPPQHDSAYDQHQPPNRYDNVKRNGTAAYPDSYDDDKRITTYFNPEDYLNKNKHHNNRGQFGYAADSHMNEKEKSARLILLIYKNNQ